MPAHRLKVADKVRLVGIAAMMGDVGIITRTALQHPHCFLKPYHTGIFLGIHAHLLTKHPLILFPAQAGLVGKDVYRDRRHAHKLSYRTGYSPQIQIRIYPCQQPPFKYADRLAAACTVEYPCGNVVKLSVLYIIARNLLIVKSRGRRADEHPDGVRIEHRHYHVQISVRLNMRRKIHLSADGKSVLETFEFGYVQRRLAVEYNLRKAMGNVRTLKGSLFSSIQ